MEIFYSTVLLLRRKGIFVFILLIPSFCFSQTENRLVHPLFTDAYWYSYFINDTTIRILTISDQNNGYGGNLQGYVDVSTASLYEINELSTVEVPGHWFNHYIDQMYVLQLKDGDVIIGNTQFDCDYPPPGGIIRLDKDGEVDWFIDFIEEEIYLSTGNMVFIDPNSILVSDHWDKEQFLIIDREGNKINKELPDTVYNITIETDSGFLAAFEERFEVLDTSFHVILSYNLADVIAEITELNQGKYLIRTLEQSYIYYDSFYLEEIPLSPNENIIGLANYYWAVNGLDQIISFDSLLTPRDTFDLSPGVKPAFIFPVGDEVVSINSFWNFNGNGTLLFKGTEEELNFSLPQDIGITGLSLPDTVFFRPYHSYPWGIEFTINAIQIEVTNFGSDTIFKFHVQAPFYWSCFWCNDYVTIWEIDTIILPPGARRTVDLGAFYSDCIEGGAGNWTLCLSTIAPNDKADANFLNDTMCNKFRLIYTNTQSLIADPTINLKPVPAQDYIFIEIEEAFDQKLFGYVYDLTGKRLKHFDFNTNPEKVAVSALENGIYVLVVSDASGKYTSKKFLVQH